MKEEIIEKKNGESAVKQALAKATTKGTLSGLKHRDVQSVLNDMLPQIAQALPKHLTPERMVQLYTLTITRNPAIARCSVQSIIGAVMQSSILGLDPNPALGQCYFVPYGNDVQFQIGYRGYMKLAQNSGEILSIDANVVYADDLFDYELGLDTKLRHIPDMDADIDDSKIVYSYAIVFYKNGGRNFVVLSRKEIEKLRKRSPSQKKGLNGAWLTDYAAMAKAKALKQLAKYMPLDTVYRAVLSDEQRIDVKKFDFSGAASGYDPSYNEYEYEDIEDTEEVAGTVDAVTGEIFGGEND